MEASSASLSRVVVGPRKHNVRAVAVPLPQKKSHLEELFDKSGITDRHRKLARRVLGVLTPACQEKLETFTVLYDRPQHRGLAGRGVIIVAGNVPDEEFVGLLLHEGLGHYRDITCITGTQAMGASEFRDGADAIWNDDPSLIFYRLSWMNERARRSDASRADFVTGYAYEADNFEDLAESVAYYMTQEQAFRERALGNPVLAKKLAWMDTYMPKGREIGTGGAWDGTIAWDATKLPFTLAN